MTHSLFLGDCLDVLPTLDANSVDTVITDPPYGLTFMGKEWDHGVPGVPFWAEVLRVAKPGAMLLAFGGTRTHHRLMCAIEDAGWEIRDVLMWLYASGFPKSHDISKGIDKAAGATREVVGTVRKLASAAKVHEGWERPWAYENGEPKRTMDITAPATDAARAWDGWGTALKPAWEPIILAMKPLDGTFAQNALRHGVAGLNIDGGRVPTDDDLSGGTYGGVFSGSRTQDGTLCKAIGSGDKGRWPANLLLDEDAAAGQEWTRYFYVAKASRAEREAGLEGMPERDASVGDRRPSGSMSQRVHADEGRPDTRARNHHPTVKPLRLMEYLCTLTATPTGGVVLDPFMGSGTTGMAALRTGRRFVGIEKEAEYLEIARRRIASAMLPLFDVEAT